MRPKDVVPEMQRTFPDSVLEASDRQGILARVRIEPRAILPICRWLRDVAGFCHCSLVAGIDWVETREVLYHLWSDEMKVYLELFAILPSDDPHIDSVGEVWRGALWHERETWDLVGIRFDHHPDLRRLFMPEGYQYHPLLKSLELHEPEELEVKARHV
jgi:NADH-quinone oxidoreductase subunit C